MRNAGTFLFAVLCSGLLLVSSPTPAQGGGKKRKAELEWTKGVANEFMDSLLHGTDTGNLMTNTVALLGSNLFDAKEKQFDEDLYVIARQYRGAKFHIRAAEIAPNGSEVVLRGELDPLSEKEIQVRLKSKSLAEWESDYAREG